MGLNYGFIKSEVIVYLVPIACVEVILFIGLCCTKYVLTDLTPNLLFGLLIKNKHQSQFGL